MHISAIMGQADGEKKARKFSKEFKVEAVRRMAEATSIVGLAEELAVRRKLLYAWRDRLQAEGSAGFERRVGRPPGSRSQKVSDRPPVQLSCALPS